MTKLTWLHLSDLHFRAEEQNTWDSNIVLKALLVDIAERMEQDSLRPDFIGVTGDIAYSGRSAEYDLACAFFDELLQTAGLSKDRLFLVPGNHDVDRGLVSSGAQAIADRLTDRESTNAILADPADRKLMLARFQGYADFVNDYLGERQPFDAEGEGYFYVRTLELAGQRVALLCLNSAWISASDEDEARKLLLGERQVRTALAQASDADLKIALLHHPFDLLRTFDRSDAEALLCRECDFVLHGHMHRTDLLQARTPDTQAIIVAAGASYEGRTLCNCYNLVHLDLAADTGTVHLRRYSDERGGFWAKDTLSYRNVPDGDYTFYFGEELTPHPAARAAFQAPRPLAQFVGREKEIWFLLQVLQPDARPAIIGIVGMGGTGKTELAKVVAQYSAKYFNDGILWADCGQQTIPTIADIWAAAWGVQLPGKDAATKSAAWRGLVSCRNALLIFDNVQSDQEIESLFPPVGQSKVLLTTRHTVHPALRGAELLALDQFSYGDATALIEKVLGPSAINEQSDAATLLFELVGYLPLALGVAIHLVKESGWSLHYLNGKLEAAGTLAVLGNEDNVRKRLNATFETAWENLPGELQNTFRTLALFNNGPSFTTLALAETLSVDEPEAGARLHRLVGHCLVTEIAEDRWALHPLLREFAGSRGSVDEGTWARMARHYVEVAISSRELYEQGHENVTKALTLFDLEWPHMQTGQAWAARHADEDDEAASLCSDYSEAGSHCLDLRLHPLEQIRWFKASIRAANRIGHFRAEAAHWGNLGNAYQSLGKAKLAMDSHKQAMEIARRLGDREMEGNALGSQATILLMQGKGHEAIAYVEHALEIARDIGDQRSEEAWLGNLGNMYFALGDLRQAKECYDGALTIALQIGDRRSEGLHLGNLGNVHGQRGDLNQAIAYFEQALEIARELGDRRGMGNRLGNLANAYRRLGKVEQAVHHYKLALAIHREIGDRPSQGNDWGNVGSCYAELGELRQATGCLKQALEIARETGDRRSEGGWLSLLGTIYHDLGDAQRAIEHHEQALTIAWETGYLQLQASALGNLGVSYASVGKLQQALDNVRQALTISEQIKDRRGEGAHLGTLALIYIARGDVEKAIECCKNALSISREIGDRRTEGKHLGSLGLAYTALGELQQAIEYYNQALDIAREIGDRRAEGSSLSNLGAAYCALGQVDGAIDSYQQALSIFEDLRDHRADHVRHILAELNE